MASREVPKRIDPDEMLRDIQVISAGLKVDREGRKEKARAEAMNIKIKEYRERYGEAAADLTDQDVERIISESEGRRSDEVN